jgi:hypothetical protein
MAKEGKERKIVFAFKLYFTRQIKFHDYGDIFSFDEIQSITNLVVLVVTLSGNS